MPYNQNYITGRGYYGPSLQDPRFQPQLISNRPSEPFYKKDYPSSRLLTTGTVAAGLFGSGFIGWKGKRLWDYYVPAMGLAEEYSPGAILRTFQLSNFFSQFTSSARRGLTFTSRDLSTNTVYQQYLLKLIGSTTTSGQSTLNKLLQEGIELRGGSLFFGGGDLALKYASALSISEGTPARLPGAIGRHLGVKTPRLYEFFSKTQPYGPTSDFINPTIAGRPATIIGGHSIFQYGYRQSAMWGGEFVDRFNRLLKAPFEMEPFETIFGGVQKGIGETSKRLLNREIQLSFAVKEGSGLQVLGRLAGKYGLALGAVGLGYSTVDYLMRQSNVLDNTLFGEGLTHGVATLGVEANLFASKVAEVTGGHAYREAQEEIAPGSTSLQKLLAFPLGMAFIGASSSYAISTWRMAHQQIAENMSAAEARKIITERMKEFKEDNILGRLGRYFTTTKGVYQREDLVGGIFRKLARPLGESGEHLSFKFIGKVGPAKLLGLLGAGTGLAMVAPFLPGALVPGHRPEELERIYSGEQDIAVRKGRFWEFGRSPYEGERVSYFRPHWYARMSMRAKDKAIYGEEEISPFKKWFKKEFTYKLEKEHYKERPYPVTALPFEDVPLVGPLLAGTIGRLIKPPVLMHTEEWQRPGGVVAEPPSFGERVATEIGEQPGAIPISPFGTRGIVGEQAYRLTEMIGLPGFVGTSIKESITGTPDLFDQYKQLESSRRMFGMEREYWDLELGGGIGTTEALRRLYPHRRRQIPLYNPIRNKMPDWLPGPGERGPDFLHDDPFVKIQEGELRLPGVGYEARFPELKGTDIKDYPLIHRYRILADVAPYTEKFKLLQKEVSTARNTKEWGEYEEKIYQTTIEQLKTRKIKKEFDKYRYLSPSGELGEDRFYTAAETSAGLHAALNKMKAEQRENEKGGVFQRIFGGYWEMISHNAETSLDMLTPVSPGAKLVHQRTAIEDYERTQVYGSANAFWQHPIRDFIKPFSRSIARSLGWKGIPDEIKNRREIEEYFDKLKYVKAAILANIARIAEDWAGVKEFEEKKDETLFGINPYTHNYTSIFRALPRRDRDYFNEFSKAQTTEERGRILELVPDNEKTLYIAKWKQQYAQDLKKAEKTGLLSEAQVAIADKEVKDLYQEQRTEGFPTSQELWAEFIETRNSGENYGDWYRRTKLLVGTPLPGPDWAGWHPSVDLEDVKLKLITNMGESMHDYDLWPSRAQKLTNKPFINEDILEPILNPPELNNDDLRRNINNLFLSSNMRPSIISTRSSSTWNRGKINLHIEQEPDLQSILEDIS